MLRYNLQNFNNNVFKFCIYPCYVTIYSNVHNENNNIILYFRMYEIPLTDI